MIVSQRISGICCARLPERYFGIAHDEVRYINSRLGIDSNTVRQPKIGVVNVKNAFPRLLSPVRQGVFAIVSLNYFLNSYYFFGIKEALVYGLMSQLALTLSVFISHCLMIGGLMIGEIRGFIDPAWSPGMTNIFVTLKRLPRNDRIGNDDTFRMIIAHEQTHFLGFLKRIKREHLFLATAVGDFRMSELSLARYYEDYPNNLPSKDLRFLYFGSEEAVNFEPTWFDRLPLETGKKREYGQQLGRVAVRLSMELDSFDHGWRFLGLIAQGKSPIEANQIVRISALPPHLPA